jgi:poly(beta-D-mannuronate) lyase
MRQNRTSQLLPLLAAALICTQASAQSCDAPPPPVISIAANSYYADVHHSVIDPARKEENQRSIEPIESYLHQVARMASDQDLQSQNCAVTWLVAWANAGALLGSASSEQAYYERKWTLAGLSLGYARVRMQASSDQKAAIDDWLRQLAHAVIHHSEAHRGERNNHFYWEGLAVAAAGAVIQDPDAIEWGSRVFDYAMDQIEPDGSLPNEMKRAGRALHYHLYAAEPLAVLSSILDRDSSKLDKLVALCIAGTRNPTLFEQRTGVTQEGMVQSDFVWLLAYARRHPSFDMTGLPVSAENSFVPRLGGNLAVVNPLEHVVLRPVH